MELCRQRARRGAPPVDLDALRAGRPQPPGFIGSLREVDDDPPLGEEAGRRSRRAPSAVFTVRLAREDLARLERAADRAGTTPSALARRFISTGLQRASPDEHLRSALQGLRSAVTAVQDALLDG